MSNIVPAMRSSWGCSAIYLNLVYVRIFWRIFKLLRQWNVEQWPWEAHSNEAVQEIYRILWNPEVHYGLRKISSRDPIISQINLVHARIPYFYKVYYNIILPSTLLSPK